MTELKLSGNEFGNFHCFVPGENSGRTKLEMTSSVTVVSVSHPLCVCASQVLLGHETLLEEPDGTQYLLIARGAGLKASALCTELLAIIMSADWGHRTWKCNNTES